MITVFNAQNYAQQWFFDKAFAALGDRLTDKEKEVGRFLSLDGYFAHMHDLVTIDPIYTMIPSDEEPFVIDANSRTISIPAAFVKCAGVVGDNMCEIATFTIDRYFDYIDLATANICIQWSTVEGEGISHIGLVDLESISGKIRFGWPLTKELTNKAGNITFAVRFFMKDTETDQFTYLFNTLNATLTIRPTLSVVDPKVTETEVESLFGKFVQNSANPSYPIPAPVYFNDNPGLNLLPQMAIDTDTDSLTMEAQAVVSDNGHIAYNWYFREGATPKTPAEKFVRASVFDTEKVYYIQNLDNSFSKADPQPTAETFANVAYFVSEPILAVKISGTADDPIYEVKERYDLVKFVKDEDGNELRVRNGSEQYFVKATKETGVDAYKLVTTEALPAGELYERFTTLTIRPDLSKQYPNVTGLYEVGASNYIGEDSIGSIDAINKTPETFSRRCYVPTPEEINITGNLPNNIFLSDSDNTVKLEVTLTEDGGKPTRTFHWKYAETKDGETETVVEGNLNSTVITGVENAGWYNVDIESQLNRTSTTATSNICRVLAPIATPTLKKMQYAKWASIPEGSDPDLYFADESHWTTIYDKDTYDKDDETTYHLMTNAVASLGEVIRLKITTDMDFSSSELDGNGLIADKIKYSWYIIEKDKDARLLDNSDIGKNNVLLPGDEYKKFDQTEIDIQCREDDYECSYYCEVENTLADKIATLSFDNTYAKLKPIFKVW